MRFSELVSLFRDRPFFQTEDVIIQGGISPSVAQTILPRWVREEKLIRLRRSRYLLPEPYRRRTASPWFISNQLYRPSYVSLFSALDFYGLIPEAVRRIEAVTPRQTRTWQTPVGVFAYRSIQQDRFWGYTEDHRSRRSAGPQQTFLIARPEKALLDLFYFQAGEWTPARLRELRLQNLHRLDTERLLADRNRFDSPRIARAVDRLVELRRDGALEEKTE